MLTFLLEKKNDLSLNTSIVVNNNNNNLYLND